LSRKAIHNWVEKFSQGRSKVADDARPGRPVETVIEATVLRQQSKDIYAAGSDALVKAMGRVYRCWWRICREVKVFFPVSNIAVLRFISICELFTDSPSFFSVLLRYWLVETKENDEKPQSGQQVSGPTSESWTP
jgi:hypothetical protein